MSAVGLAGQIVMTRATIAGLVPNTTTAGTGTAFVQSGADLRLVDDVQTKDRLFNVYAETPGEISAELVGADVAQFDATMVVEVAYDAQADHENVDQRILEDAEQISYRVLTATQASNVQVVLPQRSQIADAGEHFRILRIPFRVTYRRTF